MSRLEIILSCVLTISIFFNIGVFVYARSAILRLLWVSEELGDLKAMVASFSNHIQSVYNTEMFYGDATLSALIDHAKSFDEQLETFEFIYILTETEEEQEEIETDDNNSEETTSQET
jgi:hypothetical protein